MLKKTGKKKGVSLMVSYVLLVSIAIILSIGVFAWLKIIAKDVQPKVDCKEGTSMRISNYKCFSGDVDEEDGIKLTLRNNGRFNIDGFILSVSGEGNEVPTVRLVTQDLEGFKGNYYFSDSSPLVPGEERTIKFSNKFDDGKGLINIVNFEYINVVQIQPMILDEEKNKIVCQNSVIKQNLENCKIK